MKAIAREMYMLLIGGFNAIYKEIKCVGKCKKNFTHFLNVFCVVLFLAVDFTFFLDGETITGSFDG